MTLEQLLAFNLVLFVAVVSPGPALLVAMHSTLAAGRRAGFATGAGLAVTAAAWTLCALLGVEGLFRWFPWAYTGMKLFGGAYLLFVAVRLWRGARRPLAVNPASPTTGVYRGVLVNLLNPKSVLFAAAVLVVVFPPGLTTGEIAIIAVNHLVVELVFYAALAWLLSTGLAADVYLRARAWFDRAASLVIAALGVRLLLDDATVSRP